MSKADGSSNLQTIKLIVLNGPLSGQIFNFKPGRKVHIGRIVRGNAVTIKDAGVSSKHLLIEYQLLQGHWMVSDLESSNGTFLNGRLLDPFKPAQISHGDVVKIGESTSISVEIEVNEEASVMVKGKPPSCRGRNLAGKGNKDVSELEEEHEYLDGNMNNVGNAEPKVEEKAGPVGVSRPRRRGRNLAGKDNKDVSELEEKHEDLDGNMNNVGNAEAKVEEKAGPVGVSRRRGRNLAGKDNKDVSEFEEKNEDLDGNTNNVGKAVARKEEKAGPVNVSSVIHEKVSGVWADPGDSGVEGVVEKEEVIESGSKRVTRGMRKKANLVGDLKQKPEVGSQRTTRSMKVLDSLEEDVGQAIKKTRKGRKGKQNVEAKEETLVDNVHLEKEVVPMSTDTKLHETKDATADNNKPVMNETVTETCLQEASVDPLFLEKNVSCGFEGRCMNPASSSGSKHLDLENMTLGELFDHLEVSIPKQIIEATDKMIADMREKSKRAHEYFLQKMKEKNSASKSNATKTKRI